MEYCTLFSNIKIEYSTLMYQRQIISLEIEMVSFGYIALSFATPIEL